MKKQVLINLGITAVIFSIFFIPGSCFVTALFGTVYRYQNTTYLRLGIFFTRKGIISIKLEYEAFVDEVISVEPPIYSSQSEDSSYAWGYFDSDSYRIPDPLYPGEYYGAFAWASGRYYLKSEPWKYVYVYTWVRGMQNGAHSTDSDKEVVGLSGWWTLRNSFSEW